MGFHWGKSQWSSNTIQLEIPWPGHSCPYTNWLQGQSKSSPWEPHHGLDPSMWSCWFGSLSQAFPNRNVVPSASGEHASFLCTKESKELGLNEVSDRAAARQLCPWQNLVWDLLSLKPGAGHEKEAKLLATTNIEQNSLISVFKTDLGPLQATIMSWCYLAPFIHIVITIRIAVKCSNWSQADQGKGFALPLKISQVHLFVSAASTAKGGQLELYTP